MKVKLIFFFNIITKSLLERLMWIAKSTSRVSLVRKNIIIIEERKEAIEVLTYLKKIKESQ